MKKINLLILSATLVASAFLLGCKKSTTDNTTANNSTSSPNDQQASSEADGGINDVTDIINNKVGNGSTHRTSSYTYNLPCGVVSVDSSTTNANGKTIYKLNYGNQTACGYKKKSGEIHFSLSNATTFNTLGAVFTISFVNYVVQSNVTGQSVTLNGDVIVTNVNGGYVWEAVTAAKTIVHKVHGTFNITYSDAAATVRTRTYYQKRTYSAPSGISSLSLTIDGDSTIAGQSYCEFGKTYEKNIDYQTQVITPYVWANSGTTYAGPYVLKSGKVRQNYAIISGISTYVEVEGGYNYNATSLSATLVNDNTANAYKVTTVIAASATSVYQLY